MDKITKYAAILAAASLLIAPGMALSNKPVTDKAKRLTQDKKNT